MKTMLKPAEIVRSKEGELTELNGRRYKKYVIGAFEMLLHKKGRPSIQKHGTV